MIDQLTNVVYDTNYTDIIPQGGYVFVASQEKQQELPAQTPSIITTPLEQAPQTVKSESFFDKIF
jgi:hypothetical protein